jgi:hypothetical protein
VQPDLEALAAHEIGPYTNRRGSVPPHIGNGPPEEVLELTFAGPRACARLMIVDVVLRKLGRKGGRIVAGRLVRAPRNGSVVVIEFPDGLHEYVTTPVKRVLRLAGDDVFFLQTANSCYRLEVRSGQEVMLDSVAK